MAAKAVKGTTKLTAVGDILASAGKLAWVVATNPSGVVLQVVFNNDTGTGNEIFRICVPAYDTIPIAFNPPCPFSTQIRCGTLETGLTVTGGYID